MYKALIKDGSNTVIGFSQSTYPPPSVEGRTETQVVNGAFEAAVNSLNLGVPVTFDGNDDLFIDGTDWQLL